MSASTPAARPRSPWRRAARIVLVLLLAQAALLAGGALYQALASAADARAFPAPGRLVDVDGRRLHLYCTGTRVAGRPTVVFEGGLGAPSPVWALVQPGAAQHTRACSYDRAGF
jgi:hypothetical protein